MMFVLHGEDTASSYKRLSQIQENYKSFLKVKLGKNSMQEEITQAIFSTDLISSQKVVIVENYLAPLKKLPKFLEKVPKEIVLIFWEKSDLSPAKVKNLEKIAKVEYFKKSPQIFAFLDSLVPESKTAFSYLPKLKEPQNLVWQLQNRFLLLVLSRLKVEQESAQEITKRRILPWQWDKIKYQASKFDLDTLLKAYNSSLKIDFLTKSGKTNLPVESLVFTFLLKYLR